MPRYVEFVTNLPEYRNKTIAEIAIENGLSKETLYGRRYKHPETPIEQLLYPVDKRKSVRHARKYYINGEHKTLEQIAYDTGIPVSTIRDRLRKGMSLSDVVAMRRERDEVERSSPIDDIDIPEADPDYELKNRLRMYLDMGMTEEEILIKARLSY